MPIRSIHRWFDEYLVERGYLEAGLNYDAVHDRIDMGVRWYGGAHRQLDRYHSEPGLREWLDQIANLNTSQNTLTQYLRCGMAHFALDEADRTWYDKDPDAYDDLPWETVFHGALQRFIQRGWSRKYYQRT